MGNGLMIFSFSTKEPKLLEDFLPGQRPKYNDKIPVDGPLAKQLIMAYKSNFCEINYLFGREEGKGEHN